MLSLHKAGGGALLKGEVSTCTEQGSSLPGLALKNPPKKPTQKNPLKMFFWGFF
jgi:hypothetical protein